MDGRKWLKLNVPPHLIAVGQKKTKTKTQNQLRIDFWNKRIMVSQDTSVDTIRCHANLCHTSFIHSSVSIKTFI